MRRGFLWLNLPVGREQRVYSRIAAIAVALLFITTVRPNITHSLTTQEPGPTTSTNSKQDSSEIEQLRKTIWKLKSDNEHLRAKLAESEHKLQTISVRDHLTKEEQRAETLLAQMVVVAEKEAQLQAQLDDVNEQLRPENIEQLPIGGSLRPEAIRESTRRRLTNSQSRIQSQIDVLRSSHLRLQSSLNLTDGIIQSLRLQMQTPHE